MRWLAILVFAACRTPAKIVIEEEPSQETVTIDADNDGYFSDEDCDDNNSTIHPGAIESCDSFDNDCDGLVDEDVVTAFYLDADDDGFGDPQIVTEACDIPPGHVLVGNDCDDTNSDVYPGAPENCDNLDNDCDEQIDEDMAEFWYADLDGDGYGNPDERYDTCEPEQGLVAVALDCDDENGDINPDAIEVCDGVDNDCDQLIDDADGDVDYSTTADYYVDADGDGFGGDIVQEDACLPPLDGVLSGGDCDDGNSAVHPMAQEDCDLIDNDCDGLVDLEDPDVTGTLTWYEDVDGDGYGVPGSTADSCEQPIGFVGNDTDCDDLDPDINPDARETCDNVDENCNGIVDDAALGSASNCPALSCQDILADGSSVGDGEYHLDPDLDGISDLYWCDMTADGGGWTRLFGSLFPTFWEFLSWQDHGEYFYDDYSALSQRSYFTDSAGRYTFRLQIGDSGNWDTTLPSNHIVWSQDHDPFTESTLGADYLFISGDEPTTCGGFNGLHHRHFAEGGSYAMTSDQDVSDISTCWWMQVVPLQQYGSANAYVDGFNGASGEHIWQQLWIR